MSKTKLITWLSVLSIIIAGVAINAWYKKLNPETANFPPECRSR